MVVDYERASVLDDTSLRGEGLLYVCGATMMYVIGQG